MGKRVSGEVGEEPVEMGSTRGKNGMGTVNEERSALRAEGRRRRGRSKLIFGGSGMGVENESEGWVGGDDSELLILQFTIDSIAPTHRLLRCIDSSMCYYTPSDWSAMRPHLPRTAFMYDVESLSRLNVFGLVFCRRRRCVISRR